MRLHKQIFLFGKYGLNLEYKYTTCLKLKAAFYYYFFLVINVPRES